MVESAVLALPGACGLVNLGNTCYMNTAIQCLSCAPLLRSYLLSDAYTAELNRSNPLGTEGLIAEQFGSLLKDLWSDKYAYVNPVKLRKVVCQFKDMFIGNQQHDTQEFLGMLLDALHEDVNRIMDKPFVPEPDDPDPTYTPYETLATEAWDRYLLRNRSVVESLTILIALPITIPMTMLRSSPLPLSNPYPYPKVCRRRFIPRSTQDRAPLPRMRQAFGQVRTIHVLHRSYPGSKREVTLRLGRLCSAAPFQRKWAVGAAGGDCCEVRGDTSASG